MARTLPAAISTALAAGGAQPSLSVTLQDTRTRLTLLANRSGSVNIRSCALLTSAGTILRATVDQASTPSSVLLERITSGNAGTAASWTGARSTVATGCRPGAGVRLAQTGSTIRCFYQRNTDNLPVYRDSTNDGVTWGAETVWGPGTVPGVGASLCTAIVAESITSAWFISSVYPYPLQGASAIWYTTFTTSWSAWSAQGPNTVPAGAPYWGQIRGAQLATFGGSNMWLLGIQRRFQIGNFGAGHASQSGSTWDVLNMLHDSDNPSMGLSLSYPDIWYDGSTYVYAATCYHNDGTVDGGGANSRLTVWRATTAEAAAYHWTPLATVVAPAGSTLSPWDHNVLVVSGTIYLFDGNFTWSALATPAALDLSPDVLSLQITEHANQGAAASIILSNQNNTYSAGGQIAGGVTITVATGYNGTTLQTHTFYVTQYRYVAQGDTQVVVLELHDSARKLNTVSSRFLAYTGKTNDWLADHLVRMAGLTTTYAAGALKNQSVSCFVLTPGEAYVHALDRLANLYGQVWRIATPPSVFFLDPSSTGTSTWSYGTETLAVSYGRSADPSSVVRVVGVSSTGNTVFADYHNTAEIIATNHEVYRHIADPLLTTPAQCYSRAQRAGLEENRRSYQAQLTVSINPQHEIYDVIDITDARVGLSSQAFLIESITTEIDWTSGMWVQHLGLIGR